MKLTAKNALVDSDRAFAAIAASELDWTVVRAPRLGDGPPKGALRVVEAPPNPVAVMRADLAAFTLAQLDDERFVRRAPFVVY